MYDAVSLRFGVGFELDAQDVMGDVLILRFGVSGSGRVGG